MVSRILFYNIKNNKNPNKVAMMIRDARSDIIDAQSDIRYIWTRIRATKKHYKFEYEIAKLIIFYNRIDIINTPCFYISPQLLLLSFKHKNFKMLNTLLKHLDIGVISRFEIIGFLYDKLQELNITNILFTYINNDDIFQCFKYILFNYKYHLNNQKGIIYITLRSNYFWLSDSQKKHLLYYVIENPKMKEYNYASNNNEKLLFYSATGNIHELKKLLKFKKTIY